MKVTPKKLAANRQNARKGGPKTAEGKRIVSQNARTHGLLAKGFVLSEDEKTEFEALRRGLQEDLQPDGVLLSLLFDEVAACAWRIRLARECVQAEMRRLTEPTTSEDTQGQPAEGASRASMILANHPYTLTPFELRKRLGFLDDFYAEVRGSPHRLMEWRQPLTNAFGVDFWETLTAWEPIDSTYVLELRLSRALNEEFPFPRGPRELVAQFGEAALQPEAMKLIKESLEAIQETYEKAVKDAVKEADDSVKSNERFQMILKVIELKKQGLQEALQYAVGVETGEATVTGKNRLELFLRYEAAAKRDFFRTLEEYEKRKKLTKV